MESSKNFFILKVISDSNYPSVIRSTQDFGPQARDKILYLGRNGVTAFTEKE